MSIAATLREVGFAVVARARVDVRVAYDRAVAEADASDVSTKECTRVHDFVNRGPAFDPFWLDPLLLATCTIVFARPFKLSSFHARAVNPGGGPQQLHVDLAGDDDVPTLVGFIWMVDEFSDDNGATRFVPRGRREHDAVVAAGPPGSLVVYDGGLLHGHGANRTRTPRRSLQGAFVQRHVRQGIDQRARLKPETAARLDARAKYLLDVE
jgi:ectoine hydroxylase-related dioxygenase (phytanoyl-CoA dioxygenase family)